MYAKSCYGGDEALQWEMYILRTCPFLGNLLLPWTFRCAEGGDSVCKVGFPVCAL